MTNAYVNVYNRPSDLEFCLSLYLHLYFFREHGRLGSLRSCAGSPKPSLFDNLIIVRVTFMATRAPSFHRSGVCDLTISYLYR